LGDPAVKLLLVDDKPENLLALEELLRGDDRELFRAGSGNEALRLLLKHEFALVMLDVEMPGMDGYETAELMRGSARTRHVPVIFVTAGDRSEERSFRGYEAGAVDFLYKPINPHTLKSKVDVLIELYRKTRALATANAELERTSHTLRERIVDLENVNQTLAHDLRAPLRTIRAFSEMLSESLRDRLTPEDADALDRVIRGGARMAAMIDDLFALLRLSTHEAAPFDIDAAEALRDAVDNLRNDIEQSHAHVTHDDLPRVRANNMLMGQIFQNLIANSIKFRGDKPPTVHISADHQGDAWRFAIMDNGIGIDPEDRERVFNLFERGTSLVGGGSGVGLTLCKRAVEKLGGRIWIGDQTVGTTFYFTIPRARGGDSSHSVSR
jgi:two-component system sensor histidine kinase/response regulator